MRSTSSPLWWQNVQSLEAFNVLINYWWQGPPAEPQEFYGV
jgi:hypothetical protein